MACEWGFWWGWWVRRSFKWGIRYGGVINRGWGIGYGRYQGSLFAEGASGTPLRGRIAVDVFDLAMVAAGGWAGQARYIPRVNHVILLL